VNATAHNIPLTIPNMSGRELEYLEQCIHSGWVSSAGPFVEEFEARIAAYVGRKYAVATVNGTAALHLALLAAKVKTGEEVIVPALSFVAPANAVRYVGAVPVYIDVEPDHWQIDVGLIAEYLHERCYKNSDGTFNSETHRKVTAIVPVHILGHPVDMAPLMALAGEFGLLVIEDAAESLGAEYKDRKVGSLGDMACFSFNGNKIVTSGGGGAVVTDDANLAARARHLSTQAKVDPVEYVHDELGYNYRLTNIQAAVGCAQMEQLDDFVAAKRRIAGKYLEAFEHVAGLTPMKESSGSFCSWWLFTVLFGAECKLDSREVMKCLAELGVQSRPLWQPLPNTPFDACAGQPGYPVAQRLYRTALSLPSSTGLAPADLDYVISRVIACLP
jgi:perosamine synthetase